MDLTIDAIHNIRQPVFVDFREISKKIKTEREKLGLSITELARLSDVSHGTVSRAESGNPSIRPSFNLLKKIARIVNVDI